MELTKGDTRTLDYGSSILRGYIGDYIEEYSRAY